MSSLISFFAVITASLTPPEPLATLLCALLGLVAGSFLNAVIYRVPKRKFFARARSFCARCHRQLWARDNLPLVSFFWLGRKCRFCRKPISWRYPLVELTTLLLFLAARATFGTNWVVYARDWPFLMLLLAISVIDLNHRIIPDVLSLGGLLFGLITSGVWGLAGVRGGEADGLSALYSLAGALMGYGLFWSLAQLYYRWKQVVGLGGGDVKLLAMLGAFLGPVGVFVTIFLSSVLGSFAGLALALSSGQAKKKEQLLQIAIPYGPFLAVGALIFYFWGGSAWLQFMIPI